MSAKIKMAQVSGLGGSEAESSTHLYRAYLITKVELVDRAQLPAKQQELLKSHKVLRTGPVCLVTGVSVAAGKALHQRTFFINKFHMDAFGGLLPSNIIFDIKALGGDLTRDRLCIQSIEVAGHLSLQQWAETLKKAQRAHAPKKARTAHTVTL